MSASRVWVWSLLLAALAYALWYRIQLLPTAETGQPKPTRVVFVTGGTNDYWQLTARGAEAAAEDHNVKLKLEMPSQDGGLERQTQILLGLNAEDLDGCAVSPLDAQGQTLLINRLARKMNVVTYDSDAPLSERQYYVGTSNYLAGKIAHDLVREAIPDGGKIAVFLSNLTKNNMLERKSGYDESEQKYSESSQQKEDAPVWQTVEYFTDEGDRAKAKANIQEALQKHDDIACLVGMNAYQGPLLLSALDKSGKLGEIKLVVFDEFEETLSGIEEGHIYATVAQDPYRYGYEAVRMLSLLHNGKSKELPIVGGGAINVNCQPIRQADVEDFRRRLKKRLQKDKANSANQEAPASAENNEAKLSVQD